MTVSAVKFLLVATPTRAYIMRPPHKNRRRWFTAAHAACCFVMLFLNQAPGCKGAQDVVSPPSAAAGIAVNGLQIPANLTTVAATTASGTRVTDHTVNSAAKRILGANAARDGLATAHYRGRRLAAEAAEPKAASLMTSSMAAASTQQSQGEQHRFGPIAQARSKFVVSPSWSYIITLV